MNKNYILAAIASFTLLAASCTSDENAPRNTEGQVDILTSLERSTDAHTRADASHSYTPEGGTLTLLYGTMNAPADKQARYTCTAGNWKSSGTPLFWDALQPDAQNNYPFCAAAPALPAGAPAVAANQSLAADYTKSDLLMGYTTSTPRRGKVELTLKHVLAQLTVNLASTAATSPDYLNPAAAALSIAGPRPSYTLAYHAPTPDVPATATATGQAAATLTPSKVEGKFYLVLPPQNLAAGTLTLTVTLDGNTYTWKNPAAFDLKAGTSNNISLTLKKTGLTLAPEGIRLTPWDDTPAPVNGNLRLTVSGDPETVTGDAPLFTATKLWKGQAALTGNNAPADASTYAKDATGLWTSTTPFYIDNIAATDRFYALSPNTAANGTVIADSKTGLKDLVAAGPVQMKGGTLALSYRHLMTKLRITLTQKADFTGGDITGATVSTPAMKPAFTLGYKADDKTIAATAAGTPAAYTALTPATDYILAPQQIANGTRFTVTLANGKLYSAILPAAFDLQPGKVHTLALTFDANSNANTVAISLGVTDWAMGTSQSATVKVDGISDGTSQAGSFTPKTDDRLILTATSLTPTIAATYLYKGTQWDSTAPLNWDSFAQSGTHAFAALFTPKAGTDADNGSVKDYLAGTLAGIPFGAPLSFDLTHRMAQVRFVLKAGSGFTEADLKTATATLVSLKKLGAISPLGSVTLGSDATPLPLTLAAPAKAGDGYSATCLIAPQTVAKDLAAAIVTLGGNAYTYALAEAYTYQPGKLNTMVLTLAKSGIKVSFKVADWGTDGSNTEGDIEIDK